MPAPAAVALVLVVAMVMAAGCNSSDIGKPVQNESTFPNSPTAVQTSSRIVTHPTLTMNPDQVREYLNRSVEPDDGITIFDNVTEILTYWNGRLGWGMSEEKIRQYSDAAGKTLLKKYATQSPNRFRIKNMTQFDQELGNFIGLNASQVSEFIVADRKQFVQAHIDYEIHYTFTDH